jgi:ketosteroid isomerase-like protein
MSAEENKQLMRAAFNELATGNGELFMDSLGEDVRWTIIGSTAWSRTYEGKRVVREELMRPLLLSSRTPTRTTRFEWSLRTTWS